MPAFLPMFPLNLIVFPGETIKLHIFEPRYRQLIRECNSGGFTFGIPPVIDQKLATIGTEVRLLGVDKTYPGGEMDITCEGITRFKMDKFYQVAEGKLYPAGDIQLLDNHFEGDNSIQQLIYDKVERLNLILGIRKTIVSDPSEVTSYKIGHFVGLSQEQELQLLNLDFESERLDFILEHLENVIPIILESRKLKVRARLNGYHKNTLPPNFNV